MQQNQSIFTSHYVPIKSVRGSDFGSDTMIFTSHYVPIKSIDAVCVVQQHIHLHPIMFLLNPIPI